MFLYEVAFILSFLFFEKRRVTFLGKKKKVTGNDSATKYSADDGDSGDSGDVT